MTTVGTAPKPGIYYDVPNDEYRAWPLMHYTALSWIDTSIEDYAEWVANPPPASDSQRFGYAVDCLIHEPQRFETLYFTGEGPINPKTGKSFGQDSKAFGEWLGEEANGREYLSKSEFDRIVACVKALREDDTITATLATGKPQVCLVWHDAETNEPIKARLDWLSEGCIADLKTARGAEGGEFSRAMIEYGYHMQAALYSDGVEAILGKRLPWKWLVVQNTRPHKVRVYEPGRITMELGRKQYRRALFALRSARTRGVWKEPSCCRGIEAPRWKLLEEFDSEYVFNYFKEA